LVIGLFVGLPMKTLSHMPNALDDLSAYAICTKRYPGLSAYGICT